MTVICIVGVIFTKVVGKGRVVDVEYLVLLPVGDKGVGTIHTFRQYGHAGNQPHQAGRIFVSSTIVGKFHVAHGSKGAGTHGEHGALWDIDPDSVIHAGFHKAQTETRLSGNRTAHTVPEHPCAGVHSGTIDGTFKECVLERGFGIVGHEVALASEQFDKGLAVGARTEVGQTAFLGLENRDEMVPRLFK